ASATHTTAQAPAEREQASPDASHGLKPALDAVERIIQAFAGEVRDARCRLSGRCGHDGASHGFARERLRGLSRLSPDEHRGDEDPRGHCERMQQRLAARATELPRTRGTAAALRPGERDVLQERQGLLQRGALTPAGGATLEVALEPPGLRVLLPVNERHEDWAEHLAVVRSLGAQVRFLPFKGWRSESSHPAQASARRTFCIALCIRLRTVFRGAPSFFAIARKERLRCVLRRNTSLSSAGIEEIVSTTTAFNSLLSSRLSGSAAECPASPSARPSSSKSVNDLARARFLHTSTATLRATAKSHASILGWRMSLPAFSRRRQNVS